MTGAQRGRRLAVVVSVVALALTGCGGDGGNSPTSAGGPAQVRVLLDWTPNPDHVGFYTAQDKGFFTANNLKVALTPPANPADPLKLVAANQVELAISYEPEVILAGEQDLPVVAVAAVVPVALNSLMSLDSSIRTPADLAGKTVGTAGLPSDDIYLKRIATTHNVDLGSVKKVNVSSNLVAAMVSGQVNATIGACRNIEGVQLREEGRNPLIIPVTDAGVPQYDELVLVANRDRLKNDANYRDAITGFVAALGRGTQTARQDPAAASAAIGKVATGYPASTIDKMVNATVPLLDNPLGFGRMDPARWQSFADWLHREGMTKKQVKVDPLVDNDHLPAS